GGVLLLTEVYIPWFNTFKVLGQAGQQPRKNAANAAEVVNAADAPPDTPVLPTLFTDKADYAPGQTVQITGSGWTPGADVTFLITRDPHSSDDTTWTSTIDADGNLSTTYLVLDTDVGVTFTLTATSGAGDTAQIQTVSFTDAAVQEYTATVTPTSVAGGATT